LFLFSPAADFRPEASHRNAEGTEVWGYVDVRPGAHMFYWLYHSYHPDGYLTRPLIVWLEVQRVSTTLLGNFRTTLPKYSFMKKGSKSEKKEPNKLIVIPKLSLDTTTPF
jgi:Serine carboxypeptidase